MIFDFLGGGLGPQSIGGPGSTMVGSLISWPLEAYQTPVLDLTQAVSDIELIPAKPGHFPVAISAFAKVWLIESATGTQVTPATVRAGSDPGGLNFFALTSTPSNAAVNGANEPSFDSGPNAALVTLQRFINTPVFFDVVTPAQGTGGFSLRAKLNVVVAWLDVDIG